jgi:hypothetical protein
VRASADGRVPNWAGLKCSCRACCFLWRRTNRLDFIILPKKGFFQFFSAILIMTLIA